MLAFRVIIYIFLIFSTIFNLSLSYGLWNGDELNDLLTYEEDNNNLLEHEKDNVITTRSNKLPPVQSKDASDRIEFLIASIRESSADILQDVGDLEDFLLDSDFLNNSKTQQQPQTPVNCSRNGTESICTDQRNRNPKLTTEKSSSTSSKYVLNDMIIPSKSVDKINAANPIQDILEEGKRKIKVWEEQIRICKNILENSKVPNEDSKKNSAKSSNKKETGTIKKVSNNANKRKEREKLKRKRRRYLREGMENFRQVHI